MKRRLISLIVSAILILGMIPVASAANNYIDGVKAEINTDGELVISYSLANAITSTPTLTVGTGRNGIDMYADSDTKWISNWDIDSYDIGSYALTIVATNGAGITETYTATLTIAAKDIVGGLLNGYSVSLSNAAWATNADKIYADKSFELNFSDAAHLKVEEKKTPLVTVDSISSPAATLNGKTVSYDSAYGIDVSKAEIGDVYKVTFTVKAAGYADQEISVTRTIYLDDYLYINENYTAYYIVQVKDNGGVLSYSFNGSTTGFASLAKQSGSYYFFKKAETGTDQTRLTVSLAQYYGLASYKTNIGTLTMYSESSSTPVLNLVFNSNIYGSGNVYVVDLTTAYNEVKDTAKQDYYTIKAYAYTGGTITPSGTVSVPVGGNQAFIIEPNDGYEVDYVIVDGVNKGAISAYSFADVDADHYVTAYFTKASSVITDPGTTSSGTTLPVVTGPSTTIPSTGAVALVIPSALLLLSGLAILPKRRK